MARATLYRWLGYAFQYPADLDWELFGASFRDLIPDAAAQLGLGLDEVLQALARVWPVVPDDALLHEHTELFINAPAGVLVPLNESVYFGPDRQVYTRRTLEVARAYTEAGLDPSECVAHLLPDHLCLELEFMALLLLQGRDTRDFFTTHVITWHPRVAATTREAARSEFYRLIGELLGRFIAAESALVTNQKQT
jgi:TorA maturation chaperone TorD